MFSPLPMDNNPLHQCMTYLQSSKLKALSSLLLCMSSVFLIMFLDAHICNPPQRISKFELTTIITRQKVEEANTQKSATTVDEASINENLIAVHPANSPSLILVNKCETCTPSTD